MFRVLVVEIFPLVRVEVVDGGFAFDDRAASPLIATGPSNGIRNFAAGRKIAEYRLAAASAVKPAKRAFTEPIVVHEFAHYNAIMDKLVSPAGLEPAAS